MFGDNDEIIIKIFKETLEAISIEDFLESEDLLPEEALFYLYMNGLIKLPE